LAAAGPDLAEDARAAWESLTGGDGPEAVTQWRPAALLLGRAEPHLDRRRAARWRVAQALAALLDALGMQRYAEIARGETTRQILLAGDQPPTAAAPSSAARCSAPGSSRRTPSC
jgi:hypothetical protein